MNFIRLVLFLFLPIALFAQLPKPVDGVPLTPNNSFVLTNVKILVSPTKTIEKGSIVVRNGRIEEVGASVSAPKDLPEINGNGKVVVPAFIELQSSVGLPAVSRERGNDDEAGKNGPYYWNKSIHPENDPSSLYTINEAAIDELHKMGFGLAVVHQADGIAQGTGTLVTLGKTELEKQLVLGQASAFYSFKKGANPQSYPSSQMGCIALLRQALYDAQWHSQYGTVPNYSLDALTKQSAMPSIFYTDDKYEFLRVHAIGREFNRNFSIVGTGHEYELSGIWDTLKHHFIIPINFPEAYDLKDPYVARQIPFADLKHWELAPTNPAFLASNKVQFSITSQGNKTAADFWKNLHKAFANGWKTEDALRALTTAPAELLGIQADYGTIEKGKWACFTLFENDPFLYDPKVLATYIKGNRLVKSELVESDIRGNYSLNIDGTRYDLEIKGAVQKPEAKVKLVRMIPDTVNGGQKSDTLSADAYLQYTENDLVLQFLLKDKSQALHYSLKGVVNNRMMIFEGDGTDSKGKWIKWSAIRNKQFEDKSTLTQAWTLETQILPKALTPNMSFGYDSIPKKELIIIENATVWTNEADGIISNATVIVENGKIKTIQKGSGTYTIPAGAKVINAQGKHLTTGIIDEHSHVAISKGVNEGGQANSAEVRIGDVINPDDINVYRQLSGGVTAAQLLHGSANPVGGQSALVKLKWGHLPSEFLIKDAPKFVKFALGENVKQSNWGEYANRFPQTRMGVEQVYMDAFTRALAYHDAQEKFKALSAKQKEKDKAVPPPRDLEMDAMYEIVSGARRITCHSYIQSEINMLMHVADSFGFKINTFTHILEGYKVADKMKEHGVGASTFSDWWAYKFEVKDAVPYNAALMHRMGITVAINSDDAEMGRRLNQEAAKVIKYGGISEEEAWKMVTLNPAKLLQLDDKMGSVKVGKDADLVLWTNNPLSIDAKVLYTIVDGEILFDRELDLAKQQQMEAERARIIAKMLNAGKQGEPTKPLVKKRRGVFHCGTLGEEYAEGENEH